MPLGSSGASLLLQCMPCMARAEWLRFMIKKISISHSCGLSCRTMHIPQGIFGGLGRIFYSCCSLNAKPLPGETIRASASLSEPNYCMRTIPRDLGFLTREVSAWAGQPGPLGSLPNQSLSHWFAVLPWASHVLSLHLCPSVKCGFYLVYYLLGRLRLIRVLRVKLSESLRLELTEIPICFYSP